MTIQLPQINNYVIDHVLSDAGGSAIVYWGVDQRSGYPVAIKKPRVQNNEALRRLRIEANNQLELSSHNNPNITKLVDYVESNGSAFLIMEYVDGISLENYQKKNGPIADSIAVPLFLQMLDAIGFVHNCGYLHKDIKPGNFIIRRDMIVKLLDMGISARINGKDDNPKICGTPAFMPPEQFEKGEMGRYTDTFALGVTFFSMLTGQLPFQGKDYKEIWNKIKTGIIPELRQCFPFVPSNYQPVINKALNREPQLRFQTCREFAIAVQSAYRNKR